MAVTKCLMSAMRTGLSKMISKPRAFYNTSSSHTGCNNNIDKYAFTERKLVLVRPVHDTKRTSIITRRLYDEEMKAKIANTSYWYFGCNDVSSLKLVEDRSVGKYCIKRTESDHFSTVCRNFRLQRTGKRSVNYIPTKSLCLLFASSSIPFIGFGFLDNFLMIVAGDYIDNFFGSVLCISTMAAAALGNTISDIAGVGSASYLEKIGISPPSLSRSQMRQKSYKWATYSGKTIGITIGCLLGMFPLLFITKSKNDDSGGGDSGGNTANCEAVKELEEPTKGDKEIESSIPPPKDKQTKDNNPSQREDNKQSGSDKKINMECIGSLVADEQVMKDYADPWISDKHLMRIRHINKAFLRTILLQADDEFLVYNS